MNISKTFNRPFLYGCAVFALLAGHTQAASTNPTPDNTTVGTTAGSSGGDSAPTPNEVDWSMWPAASYVLGVPGAVVSGAVYAATSAAGAVGSIMPWAGATEAPPASLTAAADPSGAPEVPAEAGTEPPAPAPGILEAIYNQLPDVSGTLSYVLTPIFTTTYDAAVAVGNRAVKSYVETTRWADYCNKLFHDSLSPDETAFTNLKQMSQNDPIAKAYVAVVLQRALFAEEGVTPTQLANEALEHLKYWDTCGIGEATIALAQLYEDGLARLGGVEDREHDAQVAAARKLYAKVAASYPEAQRRLDALPVTDGSDVRL